MRFLLIALLSVANYLVYGQVHESIKNRIDKGPLTDLPYISTNINTPNPWFFPEKDRKGLPIYVYDDLRGIVKEKVDDCTIHHQFLSTNGKYRIFVLALGEYGSLRELLTTYDMDGRLISYLEVSYMFDPYRNLKQWTLDKDMKLEINHIKVLGEERIDPYSKNPFKELNAQRIDAVYKIDSLGHFQKQKEIFYTPRIYPLSYFIREDDCDYPIRNGDEEVKETKTY